MKNLSVLLLLIISIVTGTQDLFAAPSKPIVISTSGNLVSLLSPISPSMIPAVSGTDEEQPRFFHLDDIKDTASHGIRIGIRDSGGSPRTIHLYFFSIPNGEFLVRAYVSSKGIKDGAETILQVLNSKGEGDVLLSFDTSGKRIDQPTSEISFVIPWKNATTRVILKELGYTSRPDIFSSYTSGVAVR